MKLRGYLNNTKVLFSEHLKEEQDSILYQAREARRHGIIQQAWSFNGVIWGVTNTTSRPGLIWDYDKIRAANEEAVRPKRKNVVEEAKNQQQSQAIAEDMDVRSE